MTQKSPKYRFASVTSFDKANNAALKKMPIELADTAVHPSSFGNWCRRREVLRMVKQQLGIAVPRSKFKSAMRKLFEIGHAVHERFRDTVLSSMMVGTWACDMCGHNHGPYMSCPEACINCGNVRHHDLWKSFRYVEQKLSVPDKRFSGATDGLIEFNVLERVLEMKSEREDLWIRRKAPSRGHVLQAIAYTGMFRHHEKRDVKSALLVYVNKSTGAMKAFLVPYSEEIYQWLLAEVDVVHELAKQWSGAKHMSDIQAMARDAEFTKVAPIVCATPTVSMAASCASCKECFLGKQTTKASTKA